MSDYTLFAWKKGEQKGGMLDRCGDFTTIDYAVQFFMYSQHCEEMDFFHIIDWKSKDIVYEGRREEWRKRNGE